MKPVFLPRLLNGPFGDPGLYIAVRWRGTAVQFDLGRLDRVPAAEVLKLTHVFVSHTHMDHFYGFDRVLRLFLARDLTLDLFGPPGIVANVRGKLAGYTWNLVEGYPFVLRVHEVHPAEIVTVRLPASTAFSPEDLGRHPWDGTLYDEPLFSVRAVHLDHRIPCLGFALVEKTHLNVRKDELDRLGVAPGRWLNDLKDAIRSGAAGDTVFRVAAATRTGGEPVQFRLADLRERLLVETPGQKIAYVVDTLFSRDNARRVTDLAWGADVFFCESLFLDADRAEAVKRYHLTARQAGSLARMANVKRLEVFHFSPRYDGMAESIYAEAAATFSGAISPDEPVE